MKLESNLGKPDKIVRIVFSAIVIILFFLDVINGVLAGVLVSLSLILVVTVLFSFCPLYQVFGVNTRRNLSP